MSTKELHIIDYLHLMDAIERGHVVIPGSADWPDVTNAHIREAEREVAEGRARIARHQAERAALYDDRGQLRSHPRYRPA